MSSYSYCEECEANYQYEINRIKDIFSQIIPILMILEEASLYHNCRFHELMKTLTGLIEAYEEENHCFF